MKYYTEVLCSKGGHSMTHPTNRMLQASEDMTSLIWPHISSLPFRPESGSGKKKYTYWHAQLYCNYCMPLTLSHILKHSSIDLWVSIFLLKIFRGLWQLVFNKLTHQISNSYWASPLGKAADLMTINVWLFSVHNFLEYHYHTSLIRIAVAFFPQSFGYVFYTYWAQI